MGIHRQHLQFCAAALLLAPAIYGQGRIVGGAPVPLAAGAQPASSYKPASGRVNVIALLSDPPLTRALANARPAGAPRKSIVWTRAQQMAYVQSLRQKQAAVVGPATGLGATILGQLTKATNGVMMSIDASRIPTLRTLTGVAAVLEITNREAEATVPDTAAYIGATNLHARIPGINGSGVRVAVLDSGIDFTHRNLGGAGTTAAYTSAYGTPASGACGATTANTTAPTFTSKVVGGFDFIGEVWPNAAEAPDPNPIDCQGHGTSVADIIAGRSADGTWKGVAPEAQLFAVKVCSAVSTSCSGLAILQGFDYAVDPNGDSDLSDAVDVVNLSLGSGYGSREEADSFAAQNTVAFGTVVVASAGNSGDQPYVVGSPSSPPEVISVAQTNVNDAFTYPLIVSPAPGGGCSGTLCTNTAWQPWSEAATSDITGPLFIPSSNTNGCAAFTPGSLAGYVVLIQRGVCSISVKTDNASQAGALAVVIDNNVAGDAPTFSFGGGTVLRTTITVTNTLGAALRAIAGSAVTGGRTVGTATISKTQQINLAGSMVSSSSRGPNSPYVAIKPDIGAPGASVAAVAGSGNGTATFGGTSGAAPVVSGSAALMLQAEPALSVAEVKARLMSAADSQVFTNPASLPGVLAPITRIGAGEVRIAKAVDTKTALWDAANPGGTSISFGYQAAAAARIFRKRIVVRNYGPTGKTYNIATSFRYANDQASGGVTFTVPPSISVPANSSRIFNLTMNLNPAGLPVWSSTGVNSGSQAANGPLLQLVEYDGYVTLTAGAETVSMPWHIMPRRSHNATAGPATGGNLTISNLTGATAAPFGVYNLTGTSPALPPSAFPGPGDNFQTADLRAVGVRPATIGTNALWSGSTGVQLAASTFDTRPHANHFVQIVFIVDSNGDGTDDWVVFNSRTTTSSNAVFIQSLGTCSVNPCPTTGFFSTIVDQNSSNLVLTVPASPVYDGGVKTLIPTSGQFKFSVFAVDNGISGTISDSMPTMTFNLAVPRYLSSVSASSLAVGQSGVVTYTTPAGGDVQSPSQTGFLVMFTDAQPGREAFAVPVL